MLGCPLDAARPTGSENRTSKQIARSVPDSWVETNVVEAGSEVEEAYRMVLDATDEISAQRDATRVQTDDDADTDCL
ncbi:hypothetical protein [Amycolatopsis sp. NPDC051716]|uniref:hypothetical protein n=1 Tax=Amycolatopsis sp. NPDC051716 TaxID=3155804 RepID=UPI00342C6797